MLCIVFELNLWLKHVVNFFL